MSNKVPMGRVIYSMNVSLDGRVRLFETRTFASGVVYLGVRGGLADRAL